jgi:hypothetical protein
MICTNFGENWYSGSEVEVENAKIVKTDGQTDDGQRAIKKTFELSAQVS